MNVSSVLQPSRTFRIKAFRIIPKQKDPVRAEVYVDLGQLQGLRSQENPLIQCFLADGNGAPVLKEGVAVKLSHIRAKEVPPEIWSRQQAASSAA